MSQQPTFRATTALRRLLQAPGIVRAPSAVDALTAKLVADAGFEAVHLTGSGVSRSLGFPDVGLVSMTEMVARSQMLAGAVTIPVIADADTGYGNALNVMRTVREFEQAGVAGIHIEDQVTPKRCGHYEGKQVIPAREMALKIEAACAARRDPDFVVIARTDARAVEGLDAAIERARLYASDGADMLFVEAPHSIDEMRKIAGELSLPLVIDMFSGGVTPQLSARSIEEIGFKVVIYPAHVQRAIIGAVKQALNGLRRDDAGSAGGPEWMASFEERDAVVGMREIAELERRYLRELK